MRVGVVSDTHGHMAFTSAAIAMLQHRDVEVVLHCGDVGSADIVELFAPWPTHFVLGNTDYDFESIESAAEESGQSYHGRFASIVLEGVRIAILHSDDAELFAKTVKSGEYDLVCYGHTHTAEYHYEGKTLVLNPGALYRATPHSFAIVDLPSLKVQHVIVPGT